MSVLSRLKCKVAELLINFFKMMRRRPKKAPKALFPLISLFYNPLLPPVRNFCPRKKRGEKGR